MIQAAFAAHNRELLRRLRRGLRAPDALVEDALQFAWTQACSKPADYWRDGELTGWVYVVARHEALRLLAREHADSDAIARQRAPDVDVDALLDARQALAGLTRHQRTALTCRALGLSLRETAGATGHTYTWVNRHVYEGRRALRAAA